MKQQDIMTPKYVALSSEREADSNSQGVLHKYKQSCKVKFKSRQATQNGPIIQL